VHHRLDSCISAAIIAITHHRHRRHRRHSLDPHGFNAITGLACRFEAPLVSLLAFRTLRPP
jgi:hypothetical protein